MIGSAPLGPEGMAKEATPRHFLMPDRPGLRMAVLSELHCANRSKELRRSTARAAPDAA
jgi:hypothetical protein